MKISILLPYKENFSPNYAGAVSLFVKDISQISKYKKYLYIYGSTEFKKTFSLNLLVNNYRNTIFSTPSDSPGKELEKYIDTSSQAMDNVNEEDHETSLIGGIKKAPGFLYSTWLALSYRSIMDFNSTDDNNISIAD